MWLAQVISFWSLACAPVLALSSFVLRWDRAVHALLAAAVALLAAFAADAFVVHDFAGEALAVPFYVSCIMITLIAMVIRPLVRLGNSLFLLSEPASLNWRAPGLVAVRWGLSVVTIVALLLWGAATKASAAF